MNHGHCGSCQNGHGLGGLGAGRSRGPTKAQQDQAADVALGRDIAQRVSARVGARALWPWQVVIVGGARKMLGAKIERGTVQLQTNRRLSAAPPSIREDVATYFEHVLLRSYGKDRGHFDRIAAWTATPEGQGPVKTYQRSGETVRPDGLDLNDLYQRLVATHIHGTHFEREADWGAVRLTWGKRSKPSKRMQLALYTANDKTITMHGNLQDSRVPGYVIADNLWHEMMHHWQAESGRGLSHNAEFRAVERLFSGHTMSTEWLKRNTAWLFGRSGDVT